MAYESLYSPDIVRKLLRYEPETGRLFWHHRARSLFPSDRGYAAWNAAFAGKQAFTSTDPDGYRQGSILARKMRAHRVVWCHYYGAWPTHQIDHLNGDRSDNRIVNLRDVPNVINARNMKPRIQGRYPGVVRSRKGDKWHVTITIDYKTKFIGAFNRREDAIAARRAAELRAGFRPLEPRFSSQTS